MIQLDKIATEQRNTATAHIDELSTFDMLTLINEEDKKIAPAITHILPQIANAVDLIAARLKDGGRLFYLGAGTSGRLGILDAVECPPTYSTEPELIQGIIAGGYPAIFKAQEGAEDSAELAQKDLLSHHFNTKDILIGIAASGRTPYVAGGLQYAKSLGASTISIACSPDSPIARLADIELTAIVGPEVITGSTRMKAGTAQKLILNMLSTGTMIRLGKVYGNLMIDVKTSNKKLEERARHIVMEATGCSRDDAVTALSKTAGQTKLAVFLLLSQLPLEKARQILTAADGYVGKALTIAGTTR